METLTLKCLFLNCSQRHLLCWKSNQQICTKERTWKWVWIVWLGMPINGSCWYTKIHNFTYLFRYTKRFTILQNDANTHYELAQWQDVGHLRHQMFFWIDGVTPVSDGRFLLNELTRSFSRFFLLTEMDGIAVRSQPRLNTRQLKNAFSTI